MAINTRDIRCHVELYDTTTITHTQLKQGDTTHLILELYRDGQPHDLDGITLTLTALRPDGKAVIQTTGYTAAANVAEVVLAPAIVALSGRVQFEVTLVEVKSGDVLSSFAFARTLEPRLASDETVSPEEADRVTEIVINSTRAPYIGPDGAWWQWDNDKHAFVSTGVVPGEGGGGGYLIGNGLTLDTATNTLSVKEPLPEVTASDNGKFLSVVGGKYALTELPKYDGVYEVTPQTEAAVTLKTAEKYLSEDVTVKKIPYYEVDNESGGTTVYIGNDSEISIF